MVSVILAEGFEEIEAITPIDILRRAGAEVHTFAVADKLVTGAHGIQVRAERALEELDLDETEILLIPGGGGYVNIDESMLADRLIRDAAERGICIAAICAAPTILGKRGLLDGRRATCFPGMEEDMGEAELTGAQVEQDGNFITAKGAGAAADFGFALVARLCSESEAQRLRAVMQYVQR